jgi:hypothetical protein
MVDEAAEKAIKEVIRSLMCRFNANDQEIVDVVKKITYPPLDGRTTAPWINLVKKEIKSGLPPTNSPHKRKNSDQLSIQAPTVPPRPRAPRPPANTGAKQKRSQSVKVKRQKSHRSYGPEAVKLATIMAWLRSYLSKGPRPASEVLAASDVKKYCERTLRRAKAALKIKSYKDGPRGAWRWHLPQSDS